MLSIFVVILLSTFSPPVYAFPPSAVTLSAREDARLTPTTNNYNKTKQRTRRGACLALLSLTTLTIPETAQLDDDAIAGILEPAANDTIPAQDLEDYMVTLLDKEPLKTLAKENLTASTELIYTSLAKWTEPSKHENFSGRINGTLSRIFDRPGSNRTTGQILMDLKRKDNKDKPASPQQVAAAQNNAVAQKILHSDIFKSCISLAPVGAPTTDSKTMSNKPDTSTLILNNIDAGPSYTLSINFTVNSTDHHASPPSNPDDAVIVIADMNLDKKAHIPAMQMQTWPDNYNRLPGRRVPYESCYPVRGLNDTITMVQVWGGCCKFYNEGSCEGESGLFTMANEANGKLPDKGEHKLNDAVSSCWCTYDLGCKGAP